MREANAKTSKYIMTQATLARGFVELPFQLMIRHSRKFLVPRGTAKRKTNRRSK